MKILLLSIILFTSCHLTHAGEQPTDSQGTHVIVIDDPRPERLKGWSSGVATRGARRYDKDHQLERLSQKVAEKYSLSIVEQWPILSLNVHCLVVYIEPKRQPSLLEKLNNDQEIKWVQPMNQFKLQESKPSKSQPTRDPYQQLQSSFQHLQLLGLSDKIDGSGMHLAMVDSGVDTQHPDLEQAKITIIDLVATNKEPLGEFHGTAVASILVAQPGNNEGIRGLAPQARLTAYRSCRQNTDTTANCSTLSIARALDQVIKEKPHILNLSLSGPYDILLQRLSEKIINNGTLIVTAFDDHRENEARFPAAMADVFYARQTDTITKVGGQIVYAPGHNIITAQPGDSYGFHSGHSFSAAHLSALLALMMQAGDAPLFKSLYQSLADNTHEVDQKLAINGCKLISDISGSSACR